MKKKRQTATIDDATARFVIGKLGGLALALRQVETAATLEGILEGLHPTKVPDGSSKTTAGPIMPAGWLAPLRDRFLDLAARAFADTARRFDDDGSALAVATILSATRRALLRGDGAKLETWAEKMRSFAVDDSDGAVSAPLPSQEAERVRPCLAAIEQALRLPRIEPPPPGKVPEVPVLIASRGLPAPVGAAAVFAISVWLPEYYRPELHIEVAEQLNRQYEHAKDGEKVFVAALVAFGESSDKAWGMVKTAMRSDGRTQSKK